MFGQTTTASSEFIENVAEAKTKDDSTIFWCFDRQMYHSKADCPVLVAVGRGRHLENSLSVKSANPSQSLRSLLLLEEVSFIAVIVELWVDARLWSLLNAQSVLRNPLGRLIEFGSSSSKGGVKI